MSAVFSFSSLSVSSAHSHYISSEEKKKAHFFHFCPCFSAVSTTTVAENIPQKDSANGVGCCLGGCIIGVSGASSLCLCILDVYVSMYVCMYVCGERVLRVHECMLACICACTHLCRITCGWVLQHRFVCQRKLQSFHERVGVRNKKGKWLPGNF